MRYILFFLFAFVALPASAQRLLMVSGNGQTAGAQFPAGQPLVVRAINANGQPVPNVRVEWTGPGLPQFIDSVTNASGEASTVVGGAQLFPNDSFVANKIVASAQGFGSVEFVLTTLNSRLGFGGQIQIEQIEQVGEFSGPPNGVIRRAIGYRLSALGGFQQGAPLPNVSLAVRPSADPRDPIATCNGPENLALSDATGAVYCDLHLGPTPAAGYVQFIIGGSRIPLAIPLTITGNAACTYTLTPTSLSVGASQYSGSVNVATSSSCAWTASTNASWVTVAAAGASGQGSGTVPFSATANTGAARSAEIRIGDKTFTLTQSAAGAPGPGTLTINGPYTLPQGQAGAAYPTYFLVATGGTPPYSDWRAISGQFPPGMEIVPATGEVRGTPNTDGTFNFVVQVRDANLQTATAAMSALIRARAAGAFAILGTDLPPAQVNSTYTHTFTSVGACTVGTPNPFSGNVGRVTWSLPQDSVLPQGLTLTDSGVLAGIPRQVGSQSFTVRATDSCQNSESRTFTLVVATTVSQRSMIVRPGAVEFRVQYTAARSSREAVTLELSGAPNEALDYQVTTTTPWLRIVENATGQTPRTVFLEAEGISTFTPGQYNGSFTVTSGAMNSPITVPVILYVSAAQNVSVSATSFLFNVNAAQPADSRNLQVTSLQSGVRFRIRAETNSGGNWLTVNPSGAVYETAREFQVVANATGLPRGTYQGSVIVTPDQNLGGEVRIPVTVVVTAVNTLAISQTQLTFDAPGTQSLTIGTTTGAPIAFTAQTNGAPWLTVDPRSATAPWTVNVGTSTLGLAPGRYEGAILITPVGSTEAIPIRVVLNAVAGQPQVTALSNGASFTPGGVAAGELVTITGFNLGPATGVEAAPDAAGRYPTMLGNTQVLVDGVAAPLTYVSERQINAVIPFGVQGRTTARLQVLSNGATANQLDLAIVDAAPGIFLFDASGQAAALNQDGTYNGRLNGAEPGSIVTLYATGAGQMDVSMTDGRVVIGQPFPRPLLPVGVRIGGRVADVLYAGAAPGLIGGVLQVNARVPADVARGQMVPIQLIVGTTTSQSNVFLATRP